MFAREARGAVGAAAPLRRAWAHDLNLHPAACRQSFPRGPVGQRAARRATARGSGPPWCHSAAGNVGGRAAHCEPAAHAARS
eukprot:442955-Pyramimonas_sp.AAC.1